MAYPLINGTAINGVEEAGFAAGLSPAFFGEPALHSGALPTPLRVGSLGAPALRTQNPAGGLAPVTLGVPEESGRHHPVPLFVTVLGTPSIFSGHTAEGATPAALGQPASSAGYPVGGLSPVSLSVVYSKRDYPAEGLAPTKMGYIGLTVGMPPDSRLFHAAGLTPAALGRPGQGGGMGHAAVGVSTPRLGAHTFCTATTGGGLSPVVLGAAQPLHTNFVAGPGVRPTSLGNPLPFFSCFTAEGVAPARVGTVLMTSAFPTGGLRPISLGDPLPPRAQHRAGELRPARCGVHSVTSRFSAAGFALARLGTHAAVSGGASFAAEGLLPVTLGPPGQIVVGHPARPLRPVKLGTHVLGRGTTC